MKDIKCLRDALSLLSKSSPHAVEVEREEYSHSIYKSYLYIETSIETDFRHKLEVLQPREILFLCGSSGDGKSAILTRYSKKYAGKVMFHLDATHSFDPRKDAISTLDQIFSDSKRNLVPLVVGINIGMMGNYSEGGLAEHNDIKLSMRSYLDGLKVPSNHEYLYFEDYPKFEFGEAKPYSFFAKAIMRRLTSGGDNPYLKLFKEDVKRQHDPKLLANFRFLTLEPVQDVVVDALLKARLVKDQFMTARALLDFLFYLLTGPGYLFDNLFLGSDNELSRRILSFDPSLLRSKDIDQFILQLDLELVNGDFKEFQGRLEDFGVCKLTDPASYIRLFYLLRGTDDFGNNFHLTFKKDFSDSLIEKYAEAWKLHLFFDGNTQQQIQLQKKFYNEILLSAVRYYMNRNSPQLKKRQYYIAEYNDHILAATLDLKPDFEAIKKDKFKRLSVFYAHLKIANKALPRIPVSINLLDLMLKLNQGYRPNKHDKNTIIILDELVENIISIANKSADLLILNGDINYEVSNQDNEIFEVSGVQ